MATASWNGTVVAEEKDPARIVLVDGNVYFLPEALQMPFFQDSSHTSDCWWKGKCNYYDVVTPDGKCNANCAFVYRDPKPEAEHIRGRVAFWRGVQVLRH